MLIGISGFAQSGKDTVCGILQHHGVIKDRYAFADPIKVTCNALFGWDDRHSFGELKEVDQEIPIDSLNDEAFQQLCSHYGLDQFGLSPDDIENALAKELMDSLDFERGVVVTSPRKVYQLFGTEVGRNLLHTDVWVLIAPRDNVAIPDVRFPNESAWIHENGGVVIRVVNDGAKPIRPHESESYIESLPADIVLDNNGSLADLETQIMEAFNISESAPRLYSNAGEISYSKADVFKDRVKTLEDLTDIQVQHGNWNYDPYMHGYANGLILALAVMQGKEVVDFKDAPEEWLCDRHEGAPDGFNLQTHLAYEAAQGELDCA